MIQTTTRRWYENRRVLPRRPDPIGGIDYGAEGIILAEIREGNGITAQLIWFKGSTHAACGIRGFGRDYRPARLSVLKDKGFSSSEIFSGGRLSKTRLNEYWEAIEKGLGEKVEGDLDPKKTLVIAR